MQALNERGIDLTMPYFLSSAVGINRHAELGFMQVLLGYFVDKFYELDSGVLREIKGSDT